MLFSSLLLISSAAAAPAGAPPQPGLLVQLLPFVLVFVVFYFLLIRPQQKARQKHMDMVQAVKRGDSVVTAGGVVGKVTKVDESEITVRIAEGVEVSVVKSTLSDVRSKSKPAADDDKK